jgi:PAS domain S-box-containing protein
VLICYSFTKKYSLNLYNVSNIIPMRNQTSSLLSDPIKFSYISKPLQEIDDLPEIYKLAAIVESSDDAIISKTLNGTITSWNKGAENIFGYTQHEVIGKPITKLIPPYLRKQESIIIEKIRNGEKVEHYDTIRQTKDGRMINISLTVSPLRNEKGEITGASKIARDITERVKLDNQLRLFNEKLKEMNTYKDDFISIASHELKTPLTTAKAYIQLLQIDMEETNDKNFIFAQKANASIDKLSYLIAELLDLSKIQNGKFPLNITTFNFNEMLSAAIEGVQYGSPGHSIIKTGEINKKIKGDKERLQQVVINLLTNAVKYSPKSDKVFINIVQEDGEVKVLVKDRGIGIRKENLGKIFERYYREEERTVHFQGLGIGLYISYEIIKRHNGKLWGESEVGKGSTFYFTVPI